ncbi:MAG: iron-sulfur cluster assembly protein [Planctomycetota bacterium]|jgi:FeS assembly SUF system protein
MDESPLDNLKAQATRAQVVEVLKTIRDPELPINIYDMGLIYDIEVSPDDVVSIRMTLTSPMCPVAESLPPEVETKVKEIPAVKDASVELVWDPPWTPERMTEAARLESGFF